jgi:hypothetical protein
MLILKETCVSEHVIGFTNINIKGKVCVRTCNRL